MSELHLMNLASRQADWLSARGAVVAANIANANTPGYKARDVAPFAEMLSGSGLSLAGTNAGHMRPDLETRSAVASKEKGADGATLSGNSVRLEEQLMNVGDVSRSYSLNVNIRRAFHQMLLSSAR